MEKIILDHIFLPTKLIFDQMQSASKLEDVLEPLPTDCLLGQRGRGFEQHEGNILFREITAQFLQPYVEAEGRDEKRRVIGEVMRFLQEDMQERMRFLTRSEDGTWREAGQDRVRRKIGQVRSGWMERTLIFSIMNLTASVNSSTSNSVCVTCAMVGL